MSVIKLRDIVHGRSVFVIGSAPGASLERKHPNDVVICINAPMAPFPDLRPHILFVNAWTTINKGPVPEGSMNSMRGRMVGHLVCVTTCMTFSEMLDALNRVHHVSREEMTKAQRADLTSRWLGRPVKSQAGNDVASTGMSAILALMEAGAARIETTGFSLSGGHSYLAGETARHHADIDRELMALTPQLLLEEQR